MSKQCSTTNMKEEAMLSVSALNIEREARVERGNQRGLRLTILPSYLIAIGGINTSIQMRTL